jgi:outer membrane protein W
MRRVVIGVLTRNTAAVLLQYHFLPEGTIIHPYVGVGLNYTRLTSVKLNAAPMPSPVRQAARRFP